MNSKKTYNCYDSLPEVVQKNKENVLDLYDIIGNFRGNFAKNTQYNQRDIVVYNGSQYYCTSEGFVAIETPDVDDKNWVLYLEKGQTGAMGATGAKGDTGTSIIAVENKGTSQGEGFTVTHCEAVLSNGEKETFDVQAKDGATGATGETGATGATGATGVGITSVEAIGTTQGEGYTTTHCKVTLTDGSNQLFDVKARDGSIDNLTANDLIALLLAGNGIGITIKDGKVQIALSDNIRLGSPQIPSEGRTSSLEIVTFPAGDKPYFIRLNNNGIQFQSGNSNLISLTALDIQLVDISGGGTSKTFLHQGNIKTLFGNQSIYGPGNIDLYRHFVTISAIGGSIYFDAISSNNLQIDSLTDLTTVFGEHFNFRASGSFQGLMAVSVTETEFEYWMLVENDITTWTLASKTFASMSSAGNFTITDTVTTV